VTFSTRRCRRARVRRTVPADCPRCGTLSFRLEAGRVLGLLERTGSGKTTLARLVYRLYDPQQGAVRLGGVESAASEAGRCAWTVGVVTQDVQLFQATLRENLTFFDPTIGDEQIDGALRALRLDDWVRSLPHGLDTPLAAGGYGSRPARRSSWPLPGFSYRIRPSWSSTRHHRGWTRSRGPAGAGGGPAARGAHRHRDRPPAADGAAGRRPAHPGRRPRRRDRIARRPGRQSQPRTLPGFSGPGWKRRCNERHLNARRFNWALMRYRP